MQVSNFQRLTEIRKAFKNKTTKQYHRVYNKPLSSSSIWKKVAQPFLQQNINCDAIERFHFSNASYVDFGYSFEKDTILLFLSFLIQKQPLLHIVQSIFQDI